jgi:hypothetical protein
MSDLSPSCDQKLEVEIISKQSWLCLCGHRYSSRARRLSRAAPATLKPRLSIICFLTAIAVAMLGWLFALGWLTFALARWSFS